MSIPLLLNEPFFMMMVKGLLEKVLHISYYDSHSATLVAVDDFRELHLDFVDEPQRMLHMLDMIDVGVVTDSLLCHVHKQIQVLVMFVPVPCSLHYVVLVAGSNGISWCGLFDRQDPDSVLGANPAHQRKRFEDSNEVPIQIVNLLPDVILNDVNLRLVHARCGINLINIFEVRATPSISDRFGWKVRN